MAARVDCGGDNGTRPRLLEPGVRLPWTKSPCAAGVAFRFDPHLVRLFDKQGQGWVGQSVVEAGEQLSVSIDARSTVALQASLTSPFDFADFTSAGGAVRVARPVAVAETAGAADDTVAIVRVRQNGEDSLSLTFYRRDDLAGTIDGLSGRPGGLRRGGAGPRLSAHHRRHGAQRSGLRQFRPVGLTNVDAGDFIAMKLMDNTTGAHILGLRPANEIVPARMSAICGTTG